MSTLDPTQSRCRGDFCAERDSCMRYRQLGRDEMAPKGTLPERLPTCDTLRSAPGGVCGWILRVGLYRGSGATTGGHEIDDRRETWA